MKKLWNLSFTYFILGIASGVFYREYTKHMGFEGRTSSRRMVVVSSDLFRALQTAHAFADMLGLDVTAAGNSRYSWYYIISGFLSW